MSRLNINMDESILKNLDLSTEESRDIIELLARKRNVSNYERMTDKELLSNLKKTPKKQKNNQQQQIISKNKERIEIIRSELKELGYKLLRDEFKEIKRRLYKLENKKGLLG